MFWLTLFVPLNILSILRFQNGSEISGFHLAYQQILVPTFPCVSILGLISYESCFLMVRFMRPEDIPVQYGGLNRPSDLQNGPPKPASEFRVKGGEKVNIQIEGIEVIMIHPIHFTLPYADYDLVLLSCKWFPFNLKIFSFLDFLFQYKT